MGRARLTYRLLQRANSDRLCYSAIAEAAASANGLPSESRHTAHRSPGWMIEPPSSRTRSSVPGRSETVKYAREAVSPGPGPRAWTPRRRLSASACHPDPAAAGRGERATPRTPCQNRSARSGSSAGNSMSGAGIDPSMAAGDRHWFAFRAAAAAARRRVHPSRRRRRRLRMLGGPGQEVTTAAPAGPGTASSPRDDRHRR
jgi:hypothetical protein